MKHLFKPFMWILFITFFLRLFPYYSLQATLIKSFPFLTPIKVALVKLALEGMSGAILILYQILIWKKVSFPKILYSKLDINLKIIGHALGLRGYFPNNNMKVQISYEGNIVKYSLWALDASLRRFYYNIINNIHAYGKIKLNPTEIKAMQIVCDTFDERNIVNCYNNWNYLAAKYKKNKPIILDSYEPGHYGGLLLYKDKLYSFNKPYLKTYQIDPEKLINKTVNGKHIRRSDNELGAILKNINDFNKNCISKKFDFDKKLKILSPKLVSKSNFKLQNQGNCSYINSKNLIRVIFIALKEDANQLRKLNHKKLSYHEKQICRFHTLDDRSLYKMFSRFDRFYQVDQFIDHYKNKRDVPANIWDPLLRYIREKARPSKARSIALTKHIIKKLKNEKIMASDQIIASNLAKIPDSLTLTNQFTDLSKILGNLILVPNIRSSFEQFTTLLFGRQKTHTIKSLEAARFSPTALKELRKKL